MTSNETKIWNILNNMVAEGSATYLINGRRKMETLVSDTGLINYLKNPNELITNVDSILQILQRQELITDQAYFKLTSSMYGNFYHSTGALLLSCIDRAFGLDKVMDVLNDPRLLLDYYNRALDALDDNTLNKFDKDLSEGVRIMGN